MSKNKTELARRIYNQNSVDKMDKKIKKLGIYNKIDTITFMNLRLFSSIVVFFIVLYFSDFGYIFAPVSTILYYYLLEKILIDSKIRKRCSKLEQEAMNFFEVLTLSLETGRNLEEAINVTVNSIDSELSDEFKNAIREVKYGKSLTESLNDMQKNIPSDSINNIILTLTQADIFGNSIITTMYNQIEYLREKKILEIKAAISKVPIKISVISVLFFVPLVLLIILAPVLLNYIK